MNILRVQKSKWTKVESVGTKWTFWKYKDQNELNSKVQGRNSI